MSSYNRRDFLKTSLMGGVALAGMNPLSAIAAEKKALAGPARVALTHGDNRADMAFRSLSYFSKEIKQAIGNKLVVLKPNNVSIDVPLAATHADTLEGVLEFLWSINRLKNVVIAESAANGPTLEGFSNYGYNRLANKYQVKLIDLDQEKFDIVHVFDEKSFAPQKVRMSSMLLDSNSYIVSVARMKTHDRVIATLSLKNIVFGAPIKDLGYAWGSARKPGTVIDKPIVHGGGFRGINYNLYTLSQRLHPHLALIDGFEGMEGNGPNNGTPVDHRICVASTDWFSADRVGIELMGIDFARIGYLNYCARTGSGSADLSRIEILGEEVARHVRTYQLSKNIENQLVWMNPVTA
ncbi:MAG: DUF362 domain-containing protein [Bacteroidales bacterium]|nr:DUF362 domain-containing protein [Bacteroidales bacterium]